MTKVGREREQSRGVGPGARSVPLAAVLATLTALTFARPALSGERRGGSSVYPAASLAKEAPVRHLAAATPEKVNSFWTPQRMRSAEPLPLPLADEVLRTLAPSPVEQGTPGRIEPTEPVSISPLSQAAVPGDTEPVARPAGTSFYWPRPYDSPPATTSGKIFFTQNGSKWVCSGTVVTSRNKSLVWTAGHCVIWDKRWDSKLAFCPGYDDQAVPACQYGKWPAKVLWTTAGWGSYGDFAYDLGAVVVQTRQTQPGKLANHVGSQGVAWNQSANQTWMPLGYPQASPFDGGDLAGCEDSTQRRYNYGTGGPFGMLIYCDMTGGSSGGGWHIDMSGGLGYVNSVASLGNGAGDLVGPYMGDAAAKLWKAAQR